MDGLKQELTTVKKQCLALKEEVAELRKQIATLTSNCQDLEDELEFFKPSPEPTPPQFTRPRMAFHLVDEDLNGPKRRKALEKEAVRLGLDPIYFLKKINPEYDGHPNDK